MKGLRKILVAGLAVLVVLAGGAAIGYWYWVQGTTYVSTDNAAVTAPIVPIVAPASGRLAGWHLVMGETVAAGQTLGQVVAVAASGGAPAPSLPVASPVSGQVGQVDLADGAAVGPGVPLASVVETGDLYVTANVPETVIAKVHPGQKVDITLAAYPGTTFAGRVEEIAPATAGTFSLLPQDNTTTNFTPVTQVVPVRIAFTGAPSAQGFTLRPGESASVRIHIR